MPARTQELTIGIGAQQQSDLVTAVSAGELWSLNTTAFNPAFPIFNYETDAEDYGKGHEWVANIFPTSLDAQWEWPYYLTSQNAAQVMAYCLGNVTESTPDTGAYQYVCIPMDPISDGVNLPATTVVTGIRQGSSASEILDLALLGMICDSFTLRLNSGPGRQNSQITSRWIGTGNYDNDSGLTIPAATQETRLGAGSSITITINSVDYFSNARFVDMEFNFANNLIGDGGYYPGSGSLNNYDIRGRMRMGRRTTNLTFQAELEATSTELATLLAGTEGTATITLRGPLIAGSTYHQVQIVLHRVRFSGYRLGESYGFTTCQVETEIMLHSVNGLMTLTVITDKTGITG